MRKKQSGLPLAITFTSVFSRANANLSLLACVDFRAPAYLLHLLPLRDGAHSRVEVLAASSRRYVLDPYPFAEPVQILQFPARQVKGEIFPSSAHLQREFHAAPVEILSVTPSAN